ncbi:MAG: hypothetical protein PHU14_12795, partial [Methylovulum sp.]|nr:hypothetical protein [Methylovulum sp.]
KILKLQGVTKGGIIGTEVQGANFNNAVILGKEVQGAEPQTDEEKKKAAKEAAKAAASAKEAAAQAAEDKRQSLEDELATFQESLMTKTELEDANYLASTEKLQEFYDNKLITLEEFNALESETMLAHEAALTAIKDAAEAERRTITENSQGQLMSSYTNFFKQLENAQKVSGLAQVGVLTNAFGSMLQSAGTHNKKFFELNKAAGIANAIVATAQGAAEALKLPYPMNLVAAATVAAAGLAQIQTIRSQSFSGGGGGGASGAATGGAAASTGGGGFAAPGGGGSSSGLDITLSGFGAADLFTGAQVNSLISKINDAVSDGAVIKSLRVS